MRKPEGINLNERAVKKDAGPGEVYRPQDPANSGHQPHEVRGQSV